MENIKKIKIEDKNYPKLLREIPEPSEVLYVRGQIFAKENCFAIVGTRRCSNYGKEVALEVASELAKNGLTIVSGLAPGIDTFAHRAVIETGKRTIAVLGTGIDENSIYPRSNINLAKKILETGGALVSEYPPGTRGSKFTFPRRNRIISGLSLGILVIEAKRKSGALITANWAKSQKRLVFAVPGPIHSSNSRGCHFLIKRGAKLVEESNDILEQLNFPKVKQTQLVPKEDSEETLISEILKEGALDIDKIIKRAKLPAKKVMGFLALLEIKGKVRNLGGNVYALRR